MIHDYFLDAGTIGPVDDAIEENSLKGVVVLFPNTIILQCKLKHILSVTCLGYMKWDYEDSQKYVERDSDIV